MVTSLHFISISACALWGARVGIQVSKKEFHTYILRLGFIYKKNKNKKIKKLSNIVLLIQRSKIYDIK